jgi:DNA-binding protein HU-beta
MNKSDLIKIIATKAEISEAKATRALDVILGSIKTALKRGERVTLIGFGTFQVAYRAARQGINHRTRETIKIKASKNPRFKAGKDLSSVVRGVDRTGGTGPRRARPIK